MALVDYSSSDDSDAAHHESPPAKKQRKTLTAASASRNNPTSPDDKSHPSPPEPTTTTTALPPLPAAFHNLYATTVRPSPADQPSLHQNRRRAIPHLQGHWPSHIAVEWHPAPREHAALAALLDALARELAPAALELTTLLASPLHAPLPLHVSLSRPFVLRTAERAAFLDEVRARVAAPGGAPFELRVDAGGLAWFRSTEGGRSFLVLGVRSAAAQRTGARRNPELAALLAKCNAVVGAYGQPRLYAARSGGEAGDDGDVVGASDDGSGGGGGVQPVNDNDDDDDDDDDGGGVDGAFHVSIAWSFAEPTPELRARTAAVFARDELGKGVVESIRIPVDDVKVKIGNVVTSVPLAGRGRTSVGIGGGGAGLFGF